MRRGHSFRAVLGLAVACLLITACGGGGDASDGAGGSQDQGGEVDPTATLRLAQVIGPAQWDPHNGRSPVVDGSIMGPVYDRLLRMNGELEIEPMLATSWEVSADGRSMTLELRDDVVFHDGTPFDASAVVANVEYAKSTRGTGAAQLEIVDGVEAVDDYTVRFDFNADGGVFPVTLAYDISAGGMVSPAALDDPDSLATAPAGSGPYELVEQTQDRSVYEKVDEYWDEELLARAPAQIELLNMPDDNARLSALRSGQIDGMLILDPLPNVDSVVANGDIRLFEGTPPLRFAQMWLNWTNPELADPQVRQALNLAVDRDAINESVLDNTCEPTLTPFPEGTVGYSSEATGYDYDPERARELLEEAGATELSIRVMHNAIPVQANLAVVVQEQLAEVGVDVELVPTNPSESAPDWRTGDYDGFVTLSSGYPDPSLLMDFNFVATNMPGGVHDPQVAELNDAAKNLEVGSGERDEAYQALAEYLADSPTHLMICAQTPQLLYHSYVGGIEDQVFNQITSAWDTRNLVVYQHG